MKKYQKQNKRYMAKKRALESQIVHDSLRGFRAIVGYLQRFPLVARRRIVNAVKVVCE